MSPTSTTDSGVRRTLVIAFAIVASSALFATAFRYYVYSRYDTRSIQVTGSATRRVHSDRAMWSGEISANAESLDAAYRELERSTVAVRGFLVAQGAKPEEIRILAVQSREVPRTFYQRDANGNVLSEESRIVGFDLTRNVVITSNDMGRVERIAQGVTDLLQQGVSVHSEPVEYLFTGLANLKLELIRAATLDARRRAENVARASGATLGTIERGDVGVVQVNAANESQTSWDGVYDRTSPDKDAMVTVRTSFRLE